MPFINQLINLTYNVDNNDNNLKIQKRGKSLTTVIGNGKSSGSYSPILNIIGFDLLEKIIKPSVIEARDSIFDSSKFNTFRLNRAWNNINYKNSYVVSHLHDHSSNVLVCILYLEAPNNSGKLAIIDDDRKELSCNDFDQDKVHYITVNPNMLICHTGDVVHAVSEHLSDDRRVSIVFEYILENM